MLKLSKFKFLLFLFCISLTVNILFYTGQLKQSDYRAYVGKMLSGAANISSISNVTLDSIIASKYGSGNIDIVKEKLKAFSNKNGQEKTEQYVKENLLTGTSNADVDTAKILEELLK